MIFDEEPEKMIEDKPRFGIEYSIYIESKTEFKETEKHTFYTIKEADSYAKELGLKEGEYTVTTWFA